MNILCATDFSPHAKEATTIAAAIAARIGVRLRLVHCIADWLPPSELPPNHPYDEAAQDMLDSEIHRLREANIAIETRIYHGHAGHNIASAADSQTALTVVGSNGKGRVGRMVLGSVAAFVARHASSSVLVVTEPKPLLDWIHGNCALRSLCAIGLSPEGDVSADALKTLQRIGEIRAEAVHIVPVNPLMANAVTFLGADPIGKDLGGPDMPAFKAKVRQRVSMSFPGPVHAVHVRLSVDNPGYEMVRTAEDTAAHLVVIGSRRPPARLPLRGTSFSKCVLQRCRTNVLCVPYRTSGGHSLRSP